MLLLLAAAGAAAQDGKRVNPFGDPFMPVTSAIASCPAAQPPVLTEQQVRDAAHVRSQHGVSCHRSGRCRLPNSYLYDKEIIPRVVQFIRNDGRFDDTSLWVLGERRLVTLMGCVRSKEQAQALERAVMQVDDVMGVIDQTRIVPP